jgi:hypothetical protein
MGIIIALIAGFTVGFLVAANNRRLADKAKAEASAARDKLLDKLFDKLDDET